MKIKRNLKVLAVSSFPTVGNAGLKNIMSVLGEKVLPVPTLVISGLGNMVGNQRFTLPFKEILEQTFWMAQQLQYQLIVYTGYFNQAAQIQETIDVIHKYRDQIRGIVIDPISGDNGKPYVKAEIIKELPKLAALANWLLPNETELKLLLDESMETPLEKAIQQFKLQYPNTNLLLTGLKGGDQIGNFLLIEQNKQLIEHPFYAKHYSGTGDAFAALFMQYHFFEGMDVQSSVQKAGDQLSYFIQRSIEADLPAFDLILNPDHE